MTVAGSAPRTLMSLCCQQHCRYGLLSLAFASSVLDLTCMLNDRQCCKSEHMMHAAMYSTNACRLSSCHWSGSAQLDDVILAVLQITVMKLAR